MKLIRFLVCVLFFILAYQSTGQITEFNFLYYSKDQGLPDNRIYDFQEDLKGHIWIATQTGGFCFDGKKFTNFFRQLPEPNVAMVGVSRQLLTFVSISEATTGRRYYFNTEWTLNIQFH